MSDAVIAIRRSKLPDPDKIGNAGSFFKNPEVDMNTFKKIQNQFPDIPHYFLSDSKVKIPAGWLIESCGWKGKSTGNVGVHDKQALVIINLGGATGKEIWDLAINIRDSVWQKFNIELQTEVNKI